jgi:hypothetical protein
VLAGAVNSSPFFGDFLDLVVRDLHRRFESVLKRQHWDSYVEDCRSRFDLRFRAALRRWLGS